MSQNSEIDYQRTQIQNLIKDIQNPEQLRLIDKILLSRSSLEEKISAIQSIIKVHEPASNTKAPYLEPETEAEQLTDIQVSSLDVQESPREDQGSLILGGDEYQSDSDVLRDTFQQIYKNRKKLKAEISSGNFIQYIFQDLWKILPFARDTSCIKGRLLYFFLQFPDDLAWEYIQQLQKKTLPYLRDTLEACERKAWLFLEKSEFNSLMIVKEMVAYLLEIKEPSLKVDHFKDHPFHKLEPMYLTLSFICQEVKDLGAIIQKVYRNIPELPGSPATIISSIDKLLQNDPTKKNLSSFILSINMVEHFRFLSFEDLFNTPSGELISSSEFDCSDFIQVEIRKYVKELEFRLASLLKRRDTLLPEENSDSDSETEVDLAFFYSFGDDLLQKAHTILDPKKRGIQSSDDQTQMFEKDKLHPILFLIRFSARWLHTVKPILCGTLPLTNGVKRIFHQDVFGNYVEKIEIALSSLGKYLQKYGMLTQEQVLSGGRLVEASADAPDEFKEVLHVFDHCIFQYQQIFQVLSSILKKHTSSIINPNNVPINSRLLTGEKLTIPHIQELLDQRDIFMGRSLGESLFILQDMLIQFLNIIKPKALENNQTGIEDIDSELISIQKMIRRISSPEYYKRLREKYKLKV